MASKNYMLCKHSRTKKKLVSFAFDYQGKHEQGFHRKKCCAICGKQLEK